MSHHLPQEIVEEILHRLPAKSLVKFTSVCKAWKSLIKDQTFISDHLNRTIQASNDNTSLFFQLVKVKRRRYSHPKHFYSLYSVNQQIDTHLSAERFPFSHLFPGNWYRPLFVGTCNGLVCSAYSGVVYFDSSQLDSATIVIWNPFLRKYVLLPTPIMTSKKRKRYNMYIPSLGFGFDSRNNDYKVIRIVRSNHKPYTRVEIYSLISHSWRSISCRSVPQTGFRCETFTPLFVNGALHWIAYSYASSTPNFILSFNVIEETFGELTLPQHLSDSTTIKLLPMEGGNSLAVVMSLLRNDQKNIFSVWVMKEYGITQSWTEIFCCPSNHYGGIWSILALTCKGKLVLNLLDGAIVLVDPITQLVEPVVPPKVFKIAYAGSYVESLFFIDKQPHVLSF